MKKIVEILFIFFIFLLKFVIASDKYMVPINSAYVFKTSKVNLSSLPVCKLNKRDVVKVIEKKDNVVKVIYRNNKIGWIKLSSLKLVDNKQTKIMNELEIVSDLNDLEPVFIIGEINKLTGERKVKYIERTFMSPEFFVNIDKEQFEREVELYYRKKY